jgi:hypothetical protein
LVKVTASTWRGAAGEQNVGEPGGEYPGLAGAGAGEHEQRPVNRLDGQALFGVEFGEVVGHVPGYSPAGGGAANQGRRSFLKKRTKKLLHSGLRRSIGSA